MEITGFEPVSVGLHSTARPTQLYLRFAHEAGVEPTTLWLTARRSTIEATRAFLSQCEPLTHEPQYYFKLL